MAFGEIEDGTGHLSFVTFPKTYDEFQSYLQKDAVVLMTGRIDNREDEAQLIVESVSVPNEFEVQQTIEESQEQIFIPRKTSQETLEKLGTLLKSHPGKDKITIVIPNGAKPHLMNLPYGVAWDDDLKAEVEDLLG